MGTRGGLGLGGFLGVVWGLLFAPGFLGWAWAHIQLFLRDVDVFPVFRVCFGWWLKYLGGLDVVGDVCSSGLSWVALGAHIQLFWSVLGA